MFITQKHIPRRTFLRGAGETLTLPFVASLMPALAPAATPTTSRCTIFLRTAGVDLLGGWAGRRETRTRRHGMRTGLHLPTACAVEG
jgi:hypothetical protein